MPQSPPDTRSGPDADRRCATRPRLTLLGGFRLQRGGITFAPVASGRRLLAMLGLLGEMSRPDVAGSLWQDVPERQALGSLRTAMWRLHKVEPGLLECEDDYVRLAPTVDVDVTEFTTWARRVLREDPIRDEDVDGATPAPGDLLPGWLDDWALYERERLRQLRLHALESLAGGLCRRGEYARAVDVALEVIRLEPLRESAHRALIGVHLAEDNVVEARRQFASFRRLLGAELGIEPSAGLATLVGAPR